MHTRLAIAAVLVIAVAALAGYFLSGANTAVPREETNNGEATTTDQASPVTSGEDPGPPGSVHNQPVEPAAAAARSDLAAKLGVSAQSIVIMLVEEATWNNGCLGLARAGELCTMALVPGFKVEMLAQGKTYIYRTDKAGSNLRLETE
jgi:hypothetical protein